MIEERLVGAIETPADRKKLRWLAPPILLAWVVLGVAINVANGRSMSSGVIFGIVIGTPIAASVIDYSVNVRIRRHFGIEPEERYRDPGVLGRGSVILFTQVFMCGIVGGVLYIVIRGLIMFIAGTVSAFLGGPSVGFDVVDLIAAPISGLITSLASTGWIDNADEQVWNGPHSEKRDQPADTTTAADESQAESATDDATEPIQQVPTAESQLNRARNALEDGELEVAADALDDIDATLDQLDQTDPTVSEIRTERATLSDRLDSLRAEAADRRLVGFLGSLGSTCTRIEGLLDEKEYEQARDRIEGALETCTDAEQLSDEYGLGRGDQLDVVRSELETLEQAARQPSDRESVSDGAATDSAQTEQDAADEPVPAVQDALETVDDRLEAVQQAIESADYETAATALDEIDACIETLEDHDADEQRVAELRTARADLETEITAEQAKATVLGHLGAAASARSAATDLLDDGEPERAVRRLESAQDSLSTAEQLDEDHDLGYTETIAERQTTITKRLDTATHARSEAQAESTTDDATEQHESAAESQLNRARNALEDGELEVAADELDDIDATLDQLEQTDSDMVSNVRAERATLSDRLESLRAEAADRRLVGFLGSLGSTRARIEDHLDEEEYEQARDRIEGALETCTEAEQLNDEHDLGRGDQLDDVRAELETFEQAARQPSNRGSAPDEPVPAVQDALETVDDRLEAVQRAIESTDYETAVTTLDEVDDCIETLEDHDADEQRVAELRATRTDLEAEITAGQAKATVLGHLGAAASARSAATDLLDKGERERAVRRLEAAQDSLSTAEQLNDDHDLGYTETIAERQATITKQLDAAAHAPAEAVREQMATAEAAIQRGIDAREAGTIGTAVEEFETAVGTYEDAHAAAADHDLDSQWEIEQRASMATEYLTVAREGLTERQQVVRETLAETLDSAEQAVLRGDQHAEVGDAVAAHESLDDAVAYLDDAAQLVETGLATTALEARYDDLDERATALATTLPDEPADGYRERDLITTLQQLTARIGESPRPEFVNTYHEYPAEAYITAFGSWAEALEVANLDPIDEAARARRKYTQTEVLDAVVDLTAKIGQPPSRTEMNERGEVSSTTVANRFRDWETALELAEERRTSQESASTDTATDRARSETGNGVTKTDGQDDDSSQSTLPEADDSEESDILGQIEDELADL